MRVVSMAEDKHLVGDKTMATTRVGDSSTTKALVREVLSKGGRVTMVGMVGEAFTRGDRVSTTMVLEVLNMGCRITSGLVGEAFKVPVMWVFKA